MIRYYCCIHHQWFYTCSISYSLDKYSMVCWWWPKKVNFCPRTRSGPDWGCICYSKKEIVVWTSCGPDVNRHFSLSSYMEIESQTYHSISMPMQNNLAIRIVWPVRAELLMQHTQRSHHRLSNNKFCYWKVMNCNDSLALWRNPRLKIRWMLNGGAPTGSSSFEVWAAFRPSLNLHKFISTFISSLPCQAVTNLCNV